MVKRYIPSSRTNSNSIDTNALRDQFLRDLSKEANAMLRELSDDFSKSIQAQASQTLSNVSSSGSVADDTGLGSIGQLLTTGARYLFTKPVSKANTVESTRSVDSNAQFRVSQAQAAAEAQQMLGKGDKNL